ncbi:hypothetical protein LTR53_009321, partial [Teratosphaeriaceae sp. CCFEE 6253]
MAQTNVSSCVLSIVASFSSGLDVFKQLRETRKRKKCSRSKGEMIEDEEFRLARSLRQGPEDIGREYLRSVQTAGDHFAVGDGELDHMRRTRDVLTVRRVVIAQTSLAEILLKLNTGLVGIISSFLSRDKKKDVQLDYQSLTTLSERSRVDTCRTLRALYHRMEQAQVSRATHSRLALQSTEQVLRASDPSLRDEKKQRRRKHSQVQGPMLARVVIENSSKPPQIALVKPGERRKKSGSASVSRSQSETPSAARAPLSPPPPYDAAQLPLAPSEPPPQPLHPQPRARRKRSTPDVSHAPQTAPPARPAAVSSPRLHAIIQHAHEPILLPHIGGGGHRRRKATPTYYSIASDGTKLGEIPLHRWPVPFDFDAMSVVNKEAEVNGWPVNQLGVGEGRKKRFGLMRLFRRKAA